MEIKGFGNNKKTRWKYKITKMQASVNMEATFWWIFYNKQSFRVFLPAVVFEGFSVEKADSVGRLGNSHNF